MNTDGAHLQIPQENPEIFNLNNICRLCANADDKLINLYGEEGVSNDLPNKINLYLPIKIMENDELPSQCCWGCASTIIAWHELFITSVEADRKLRNYQFESEKIISDISFENPALVEPKNEGIGADAVVTSLNDFCQTTELAPAVLPTVSDLTDKKPLVKQYRNRKKQYSDTDFYQNDAGPIDSYITDFNDILDANPTDNDVNDDDDDDVDDDDNRENNIDNEELEIKDESGPKQEMGDMLEMSDGESREGKIFSCPYCSAVFVQRNDVKNHIENDHPGWRVISPVPKEVPKETTKKSGRRNNRIDQEAANAAKVVVDGRIYYNCKECGKSLHSPYTYIWHMRIHTGERPFVCDLCGKQFRVSQGLVRHLRETHQGIKKFPCDLCGRMFATRRNVEEHRRIHTNERPYVCDLCGKAFKQKASLFVHNRSHKNHFPFQCSYCDQSFRTKPPLMVHITRHTGEKPYKCETCGRCFRIKYELKRHRLIHSDEKPFVCNVCGLSFRQKRYLRNHMKSNHNSIMLTS